LTKKRREEELEEEELELDSEFDLEWVMAALTVILVVGFLAI
jgi:hypothetical protein